MHVIKNFYLQLNTLIMKCQGQTILLRYKCNSLYPSSIQHAIKFQGMKITLSIHYKLVRHNRVLLYLFGIKQVILDVREGKFI